MSELMEKFWNWLDGSAPATENSGFVFRPDAPPETAEAYEEYCCIDEEAKEHGIFID